ncbi:MAG TPA: aminoacyl-tRNA hydrolase [Thermoleophilia bacterium]|nr:aminoacyl-tRNA hydrolase [Thermoleophilia bacterium]
MRALGPPVDWLVAGLGNPGARYRRTRHNVGFMVAELLAAELGGEFRDRFSGRFADVRSGELRLGLLCPETYMNDSGRSVGAAVGATRCPLDRLVVVHDELDLALGDIRTKRGGGLAGHNGLRSLAAALGGPGFNRVRIGIGRPERGDPRPIADWVLMPFEPEVDVDALVRRAADRTLALIAGEPPDVSD